MNPSMKALVEIIFNTAYLAVIWPLGIIMVRKLGSVPPEKAAIAKRLAAGVVLLAIGDTGHVGFRVVAFLRSGLEHGLEENSLLVGLGALSTAITVTFLYVLLLDIWRIRFGAGKGRLYLALLLVAVVRLLLFLPAQNRWGSVVPPFEWSLYRNLPLTVLGLSIAVLYLKNGIMDGDRLFTRMSVMIFLSYAFYIPVILFVQRYPLVGMLMIPKTLAYIGLAFIAYRGVFRLQA